MFGLMGNAYTPHLQHLHSFMHHYVSIYQANSHKLTETRYSDIIRRLGMGSNDVSQLPNAACVASTQTPRASPTYPFISLLGLQLVHLVHLIKIPWKGLIETCPPTGYSEIKIRCQRLAKITLAKMSAFSLAKAESADRLWSSAWSSVASLGKCYLTTGIF